MYALAIHIFPLYLYYIFHSSIIKVYKYKIIANYKKKCTINNIIVGIKLSRRLEWLGFILLIGRIEINLTPLGSRYKNGLPTRVNLIPIRLYICSVCCCHVVDFAVVTNIYVHNFRCKKVAVEGNIN